MKLLLTSSGIRNTSIQDALVDLLGKPIAESSARRRSQASWPSGGLSIRSFAARRCSIAAAGGLAPS